MNDWGGPIGLDFARRRPERVKRLVIANTWCWPVGDDLHFKSFSFLMSSWTREVEIQEFEDCGHSLAEEAQGRVVAALRDFMGARSAAAHGPFFLGRWVASPQIVDCRTDAHDALNPA